MFVIFFAPITKPFFCCTVAGVMAQQRMQNMLSGFLIQVCIVQLFDSMLIGVDVSKGHSTHTAIHPVADRSHQAHVRVTNLTMQHYFPLDRCFCICICCFKNKTIDSRQPTRRLRQLGRCARSYKSLSSVRVVVVVGLFLQVIRKIARKYITDVELGGSDQREQEGGRRRRGGAQDVRDDIRPRARLGNTSNERPLFDTSL